MSGSDAVFGFILTADEWSTLLSGLRVSLQVTCLALLVGFPVGIALAVAVMSRSRLIRWPTLVLVEIGRGVPLLVLLYFVYYGLPDRGITLTATAVAVVAFGINVGAYTSEFFRASIRAVPHGQREAAWSMGLSQFTTFRRVVLPQALRIATPQMVSHGILTFQATALCFAITLPELLSAAYQIATANFLYLKLLGIAALMYAAIALPLTQLVSWLERRTARRL